MFGFGHPRKLPKRRLGQRVGQIIVHLHYLLLVADPAEFGLGGGGLVLSMDVDGTDLCGAVSTSAATLKLFCSSIARTHGRASGALSP